MQKRLVMITGPVGGGKSTSSIELGKRLRLSGLRTAVVDLDDMYLMGKQKDDDRWDEPETWTAARRACGAVAEAFFTSGYDAVIAEGGDFGTPESLRDLMTSVRSDVDFRLFTLVVSWEVTYQRAMGDPDRNVDSKEGYRKLHNSFVKKLPFLCSASECIDTDHLSPDLVSEYIAKSVLSERPTTEQQEQRPLT